MWDPNKAHWIHRFYSTQTGTTEVVVCSKCRTEFTYDAETGMGAEKYWRFCPICGNIIEKKGKKI